jgi:hypothetical protein
VKVLAIFGGLGLFCLLMCGGAFALFAFLGARHSGWEPTTFHGYTVKMPPGGQMKEKTTTLPGATIHEHGHRRRETGSQYFLMVSEPLAQQQRNMDVNQMLRNGTVRVGNQRAVERAGIAGIRGTILDGELKHGEAEYFMHNGRLIVTAYAPYSEFRDRMGGKRQARSNESELDKPEEFFESLQVP